MDLSQKQTFFLIWVYNQIKNILIENNLICELRVFGGVSRPNFSVGHGLPLDKKQFSDNSSVSKNSTNVWNYS